MKLIEAIKKMTSADDLLEVVAAVRNRVKELPDMEQVIYYETDTEADKELGEEIKADEKPTAEIKEGTPEEEAPAEEPAPEQEQPEEAQPNEETPPAPQEPETPPMQEPDPQETDLQEPIQQEEQVEQVEQANRRIDSLEAQIIELKNQLEAALSEIEKKPFGLSPTTPTGGEPEADEDTRIMQSYYKGRYRK